jgi:hypothetical protein
MQQPSFAVFQRKCPANGRTIAEVVSRWFPTTAARVRARVWSSGICDGQTGAGQFFSEYFGFPAYLHSTKFSIIKITETWTIGQSVADVPSGPCMNPTSSMRINWKKFLATWPLSAVNVFVGTNSFCSYSHLRCRGYVIRKLFVKLRVVDEALWVAGRGKASHINYHVLLSL